MQKTDVIAILCSDLHLSHNAPKNRAEKGKEWYEAMGRSLFELRLLQNKYDCPVLCAGDIFDKWDSPAELINFAIDFLPDKMYAVPGQHDLPLHDMGAIHKSAYWTLVAAGKINQLRNDDFNDDFPGLVILGFPWGTKLKNIENTNWSNLDDVIKVAVVHKYCWTENKAYPGAKNGEYFKAHADKLKGFDVAVFGDNHKSFLETYKGMFIWNNGLFLRRKIDERNANPQVGLLTKEGTVIRHSIMTEDKWIDQPQPEEEFDTTDMKAFVKDLIKVQSDSIEFKEILLKACKSEKVNKEVKEIILESLEK